MTTKKQSPISKHKHTITRRAVQAGPQAFDIIPRSQVRPSTTSRPVIPSKMPDVADTTLTTPATVKFSHQTLVAEEANNMAVVETVSKPIEPGISVAELIAKKSEPVVIADLTTEPVPDLTDKPQVSTAKVDEPDALAQALKPESDDQPQEHSEALKDAIKDLDGQAIQSHHELYGGKPVIVVHKPHSKHFALMWSLWFFLCVGLALLIVNLLLDAGVIETNYNLPYTNIL